MALLKTILLIDDDDTTNFLHKRLLQRLQVTEQIVVAGNGEAALAYLQQTTQPNPTHSLPDLIFLDIKMPVMDGFEFLAAYEKLPLAQANYIPIYMLSTSVSPTDRDRLKKYASVTSYLAKPLTEDKVNQLLSNLPGCNT